MVKDWVQNDLNKERLYNNLWFVGLEERVGWERGLERSRAHLKWINNVILFLRFFSMIDN